MPILQFDFLGQPLWMWLAYLVFVTVLLVFDLGVLSRRDKEISVSASLKLSAFYIAMGVAFAGFVWWRIDSDAAVLYLTGYVIEKSLSLDNIFVIALIFGYFSIPRRHQHRALVFGIIGVIILRGAMVAAGSAIVSQFHWVLYLFAAFLIFTGIRMLFNGDEQFDVSENRLYKFLHRNLPLTRDLHGDKFFVCETELEALGRESVDRPGRRKFFATPLFVALVMVEFADVVFAVDSVPAIFSITTDPYIVFTSNISAILGLRALYFALSAMLERFSLLKYALSAVLIFIGGKILIGEMLGMGDLPPLWSLAITVVILASGVIGSLVLTRKH
ncbi:TerC family protein [Rhizobium halophytocola]|uniref:Tellurite resistance protein TerC n=1 Tax=Rhizobium halophytocola TaxID=735519 RepID=A0ABS4DXK9_9HYPH|nr:TerC family protein [Rhizobium halophytocola]MBP1850421.1 tellurite resistance protein TerC [Rhizobium halophytocola]